MRLHGAAGRRGSVLAGTPAKRQHQPPLCLCVNDDQSVERMLAAAKGMQQAQAHKVVVARTHGLYQGQRAREGGRGNVCVGMAAEHESLQARSKRVELG